MSIYALFSDNDMPQIASNGGWRQIEGWAEEIDSEAYPSLVQLIEHGVSEQLSDIRNELLSALRDSPPDEEDAVQTCENLLQLLDDKESSEFIVITNGMTAEGYDEEAKPGSVQFADEGVPRSRDIVADRAEAVSRTLEKQLQRRLGELLKKN